MTPAGNQAHRTRDRFIVRVTIGYGLFALAWIFLSDRLLSVFADVSSMVWLSSAKGAFFVGTTTILLFFALRFVPEAHNGDRQLFFSRLGLERKHRWLAYSLSVIVTLAMLAMSSALSPNQQPASLLILFMLPITLSALLGGLGPGLASTAIAAAGVAYLAMLPAWSFASLVDRDLMLWGFLVANGLAVSAVSEVLHRSFLKANAHQRLLDAVISGTTDSVFVKDRGGRYILVNEAGARVMGMAQSEIIGRSDFDLFATETAENIAAADQTVMETATTQTIEEQVLTLAGKSMTFLITRGPVLGDDGQVAGMFGISHEITTRTDAERALKESKSALNEAQRQAGIGSWSLNLADGSTTWSEQLARMMGFAPDAPPPSRADAKRFYAPESWARVHEATERAIAEGIPYEIDAETVSADGSAGWVIARAEAVRNATGKIVMLRGTVEDITARKQAELALREAQRMAQVGDWTYNLSSGRTNWSEETARMFTGDPMHPTPGFEDVQHFFEKNDWEQLSSLLARAIEHGEPYQLDLEIIRPDKRRRWITTIGTPVRDAAGKVIKIRGMVQDVTDRKAIEEEMHKLVQAVEQSPESIVITDLEGNIEYVNKAFTQVSGYSREEVLGSNSRLLKSGSTPSDVYESLWRTLANGETWQGEFRNRRKDGSEYVEHAIVSAIYQADGKPTHYLAVKENVTEKKRNEERIHRLVNYDPLTDLPNRTLLLDYISRSAATDTRNDHQGALIMFNIDRFKAINDVGGQAMGDELLRMVAQRLMHNLREGDVVARVAGDEFAVLITDLATQKQVAANLALYVAEKIHGTLRESFYLADENITLTASLGIALFPDSQHDTALDIQRRANTALHHAKTHGGGQTAFFESSIDEIAKQRFAIERELHLAIGSDQLRVYLQSQVSNTGAIVGGEALVRWQHPQRGLVMPGAFIPIAEESDLIVDLGNWMLTHICHMLAREHMAIAPRRISVNISPRHFRQATFVHQIRNILAITGADPARLTLEVTEGMLIENINDVVAKMNELNEIGVHFSLDDFGTGYSSLSYLKRLPIHEIKIDKTFVQDMTSGGNDASLVETILSIAKHMNLHVVAEGVETAEQADFLNQRGQVIHQGYFFGKPEPDVVWLAKLKGMLD